MSRLSGSRWVTFGCYGTLVHGPAGSLPLRLFDDVEEMLAGLRAQGYRLGVLTNCDDALFERAHRTFRTPFDLFVTAERVRGRKPSPWHFRAFEQIARASRCDWVHVACSPYHDLAPAAAFGVRTVWLDRGRTHGDPSVASAHVHSAAGAVDAVAELFEACASMA